MSNNRFTSVNLTLAAEKYVSDYTTRKKCFTQARRIEKDFDVVNEWHSKLFRLGCCTSVLWNIHLSFEAPVEQIDRRTTSGVKSNRISCLLSARMCCLVTPGRFELPTCGLGNRRSIHLSYGAIFRNWRYPLSLPQTPFAQIWILNSGDARFSLSIAVAADRQRSTIALAS